MAKPGPAPKPRNLKIVAGTLRPDRDNPDAPEPEVAIPDCPEWLGVKAKAEWGRVTPLLEELGLISLVSRAALAGYCQSYQQWVSAEKVLAEEGFTFTSPKGHVCQRPEVAIANTAKKEMRAFLQEFGMTPSSAMRVKGRKPRKKTNPFEAL